MIDHSSPLRYPGGKGKLAPFVESVIQINALSDGCYVEPFAGGASIALSLLFREFVSTVVINDLDRSIYAFWHSVLNRNDEFCARIESIPLSINEWRKQKQIQKRKADCDLFELGLSTFYLNRTNRSGTLNGGVIGGLKQNGNYKIDARFNRARLIEQLSKVAKYRDRISLYNLDVLELVPKIDSTLPGKSLYYFDPPYYYKGKALYYSYFKDEDHQAVAKMISELKNRHWLVSYDSAPQIINMYSEFASQEYTLNYCAFGQSKGQEIMFHSQHTKVPNT